MIGTAALAAAIVTGCVAGIAGTVSADAATASAGAASAPAATAPAVLAGLACRTLNQCVAVGANTPTMPTQLAAGTWNGKKWARVAVPKPSGSGNVSLGGVACPAANECVAVGDAWPLRSGSNYAIASYWNGKRWTTGRAADPSGQSLLTAISCATATSCFAVGQVIPSGKVTWTGLIEHWDGKHWAQQAAPLPHGTSDGTLNGVSCLTKSFCVAVGNDSAGELIERWNGKAWSATGPGASPDDILWSVSCPAAATCFAVGGDVSGGVVVERWNGKSWSSVAAPAPSAKQTVPSLQSVSCASATRCLAVGNDLAPGVFADAWNGSKWRAVGTSFSGGHIGSFEQVSCLGATNCVALGSVSSFSAAWRSESAFWNGKSWRVVPTA
jgi:hypothetical protein